MIFPALLTGLFLVLRADEMPVGALTDDALYVELARSVAEGQGHTLNIGPGLNGVDMDLFPPGLAYLLAPLAALRPHSLEILKLGPLLAGLIFLVLTWFYVRRTSPFFLALSVVFLTAWNPFFVASSTRVLSDMPHAALALAALLVMARALESREPTWRSFFLAGVLAGGAIAMRSVGWAVAVALLLVGLWEGRGRILGATLLGILAVLGPMWLGTVARPLGQGYLEQMVVGPGGESWWRATLHNGVGYLLELVSLLVPVLSRDVGRQLAVPGEPGLALPLIIALMGTLWFLVWRGGRRLRDRPETRVRLRLAAVFGLVTLVVLWNFRGYPSGVQTRLLLPLLPLFLWLSLTEVWPRRTRRNLLVGLMAVSALAVNGWRIVHPPGRTINADGSGLVDPGEGTAWVRDNTPAAAVIMTRDPIQRHIHWERQVVDYPDAFTSVDSAVSAGHVDLVLVSPVVGGRPHQLDGRGRQFLEGLRARPERFTPVLQDSARALYFFSCASENVFTLIFPSVLWTCGSGIRSRAMNGWMRPRPLANQFSRAAGRTEVSCPRRR